ETQLPGNGAQPGPRIPDKFVALSVDCNAVYVYLDPYEGGKIAVAECARNLACAGAVPLGTTDNLNFGNPHNPEIFWQLRESVRGIAEGCRSEEHTSELQSLRHLVCRLLLEKKQSHYPGVKS